MKIIIFGASEFPHSKEFSGFKQLENSAIELKKYFENHYDKENILWFFNMDFEPKDFYNEFKKIITSDSTEILLIYYLGHGFKLESELYLTIRKSKDREDDWYSIEVRRLSRLIKNNSYKKKIFFILDCCYAGEAFQYFLSSKNIVDQSSYKKYFDDTGTVLLGSASMYEEASATDFQKGEYTLFSHQFINILKKGINQNREYLTIEDIYKEIRYKIRQLPQNKYLPEPVLHYSQRDGDCREYPLFPNLHVNVLKQDHKNEMAHIEHDSATNKIEEIEEDDDMYENIHLIDNKSDKKLQSNANPGENNIRNKESFINNPEFLFYENDNPIEFIGKASLTDVKSISSSKNTKHVYVSSKNNSFKNGELPSIGKVYIELL